MTRPGLAVENENDNSSLVWKLAIFSPVYAFLISRPFSPFANVKYAQYEFLEL